MRSLIKHVRERLLGCPRYPPRVFPAAGPIPTTPRLEEGAYRTFRFYPARIGEVLDNGRYQIVGKLGYGTTSTVWLCKDLENLAYKAMKICIGDASGQENKEIKFQEHIATFASKNVKSHVRMMERAFFVPREEDGRRHACIVLQPFGMSLHELRQRLKGQDMDMDMPVDFAKAVIGHVLLGLHFLHTDAKLIHTDLQPKNVVLGIRDTKVLEEFERQEMDDPTPRKILDDRVIYESRPMPFTKRLPALADLGQAHDGPGPHTGLIMPYQYRAPEVNLGIPWSYGVDIWAVGALAWDLLEPNFPFDANKEAENEEKHLANKVALLGLPPQQLLPRGSRSFLSFDEDGEWIGDVDIPETSFEDREKRFEGEKKALFLKFIRKTFQWVPEARPTARELLEDEWLHSEDD